FRSCEDWFVVELLASRYTLPDTMASIISEVIIIIFLFITTNYTLKHKY
ncbi:MAG: hypothetical protein QG628_139, partial [Patescibacteria group bacterium]|nr:hypothetical protein [Patescibacteria group bacterium]